MLGLAPLSAVPLSALRTVVASVLLGARLVVPATADTPTIGSGGSLPIVARATGALIGAPVGVRVPSAWGVAAGLYDLVVPAGPIVIARGGGASALVAWRPSVLVPTAVVDVSTSGVGLPIITRALGILYGTPVPTARVPSAGWDWSADPSWTQASVRSLAVPVTALAPIRALLLVPSAALDWTDAPQAQALARATVTGIIVPGPLWRATVRVPSVAVDWSSFDLVGLPSVRGLAVGSSAVALVVVAAAGKYRPEWSSALADTAGATGFGADHASALTDIQSATGFARDHASWLTDVTDAGV